MKAKASLFLIAILATGAGACGNRLLVGSDPDGGSPPVTPTGAAGTGTMSPPATSGAAGTGGGSAGAPVMTGSAGSDGAPTTTRPVTPLRITGEEAVTRIADMLWKDVPSNDLLSQARLGHFKTTEDLYGAIRQMLADPRARKGVGEFFRAWLHLYEFESQFGGVRKDPQVFPELTEQLGLDMATETTTFGVNVTLEGNTFTTLMTAPYSYLNGPVGQLYGINVTGDDFKKVFLNPNQRAGLLTQPSLQTLQSLDMRNSPSRRGEYVLTLFECMQVPPPPDNVEITGLGVVTKTTVRQALAESVSQQAACAACHALLDPPGLAFETFDAIGRWRTTDNGFPLDMSNIRVMNLSDDSGPTLVDGPVQLAKAMAASRRVQDCYAKLWLAWALGGAVPDDEVTQSVAAIFRTSGLDLKELIATVLLTDRFLAP